MKKNIKAKINKIKFIIEGLKVAPNTIRKIPPFRILLLFVSLESKNFLFLINSEFLNAFSEKSFKIT